MFFDIIEVKWRKSVRNATKFLTVIIFLFLLNITVYSQNVISQERKNFLWKVKSEDNTVYVLGSLHMMKQEDYPLNKNIEDAFSKCEVLAVEANINDISQFDIKTLMESAFYPDGETIEDHVSQETYEIIKSETERLGLPILFVNRQKPWFLALTLTSTELLKIGFNPSYGIDMHFINKANGQKKVIELESLDYQFNLLSNLSDDEQESLLLYTFKDLHILEKELLVLTSAWKSGDVKTVESIMIKSFSENGGMFSFYEKLINKRNRNMVSKIEEYLEDDKPYFVIIGAGHLVGKKGIIELLKDKGYAVEQM